MAFRQLDREVGAELVCIMQAGKVIVIEKLRRAMQVIDMIVPGGNDILLPADADRAENRVPELCNGLVFRSLREDLLRPGSRRHGGDAPGVLVRHEAGAVFEQRGSCRLLRERQPLGIDARKDFRVARGNRNESRTLLGIIRIECAPPFGKLRKDGRPGHVVLDAGRELVAPAHDDFVRPSFVCFFCEQAREWRAFDGTIDDENLVMLEVDADAHDEACISLQQVLCWHI